MLVDDNEIDNLINQKMLESSKKAEVVYSHTSAKSALEFLRNLDKIPVDISGMIPQVIFLDINMPIMDGFQFMEEFGKLSKKVREVSKIVLLTSSLNPQDMALAKEHQNFHMFMNKPLTEAAVEEI